MNHVYLSHIFFSILLLASAAFLNGYEMKIIDPEGEAHRVEISEEQSLQTVIETIEGFLAHAKEEDAGIQIQFTLSGGAIDSSAKVLPKHSQRNYSVPLTASEKKDLTYILRTLANSSLARIAKERTSLKRAGDRIDSLHPFKFLEAIFTDEELKVCVRNIDGRGWVWSGFLEGIVESLEKEASINNLTSEHIRQFALTVQVDVIQIQQTIQEKNWLKLVSDLILLVPRNGNNGRYNM